MNIFRIFFVSTVLIPVLVVVATSDDTSGIRIRRPTRSILISEDGTRPARRIKPVNISDRNCPALGCTGNLTSDTFNGKGSVAATLLVPSSSSSTSTSGSERFDASEILNHHHPLKLEIKSIKNSTKADSLDSSTYVYSDEVETGKSAAVIFPWAAAFSWVVYWGWKAVSAFIVFRVIRFVLALFKIKLSIVDNYVETYVKLGQDSKHPFSSYGGGWNPTFGVSLKSKADKGWKSPPKGWKSHPSPPKYVHSYYSYGLGHRHHHHHHRHHSTSYHHSPSGGWGWPKPKQNGWKSSETSSEEEDIKLRDKYDQTKGYKYAKKYTKKYGKKAHKYGLRPHKFSHIYDEYGNVLVGWKGSEHVPTGWGRLGLAADAKNSTKIEVKKDLVKGETSSR